MKICEGTCKAFKLGSQRLRQFVDARVPQRAPKELLQVSSRKREEKIEIEYCIFLILKRLQDLNNVRMMSPIGYS